MEYVKKTCINLSVENYDFLTKLSKSTGIKMVSIINFLIDQVRPENFNEIDLENIVKEELLKVLFEKLQKPT